MNTEKDFLDEEIVIDESMGTKITLALLLWLLSIPGFVSAKDIEKNLPKGEVTYSSVTNALNTAAEENAATNAPSYGGYTIVQAANIVARTLFDEARGEGEKGIDAVASVLYNRAAGKAVNLPGVCLKKYQFSKWNGQKNLDPKNYKIVVPVQLKKPGKDRDMWSYCQKTAGKLIYGEFKSTIGTKNSYYAHDKVTPNWANKMSDTEKIGNHTFGYLSDQDGFATKKTVAKKTQPKKAASSPLVAKNGEKVYIVKKGDTLNKIAVNHKTTVAKILAKNPKLKKNPNKIEKGSRIIIPS